MTTLGAFANEPVLELRRTAFGPVRLGGLREGAWRRLGADEVERLRAL